MIKFVSGEVYSIQHYVIHFPISVHSPFLILLMIKMKHNAKIYYTIYIVAYKTFHVIHNIAKQYSTK